MESELVIRKLNEHDHDEKVKVIDLVNLCYRGDGNWTTETGIVSGPRITLNRLEQYIRDYTMLVASFERRLVGCLRTGLVNGTVCGPLPKPAGYLGLFAIHPTVQSRGFGSRLMRAAEDLCRTAGAHEIVLDVLEVRKDIIAMYERKGYKIVPNLSISAKQVIEAAGENMVSDPNCRFIVLSKTLNPVMKA